MRASCVAYTGPGCDYPPYINFAREGDEVVVRMRGRGPDGASHYIEMSLPPKAVAEVRAWFANPENA
jgi:hypothetical protein